MIAQRAGLALVVFAAALALAGPTAATPPGANGRIVFTSTRDGNGNPELYSVAANGTGLARLTWSSTVEQHPSWSPDGSRIAFESFAEGSGSIHVMNADGSDEQRISPDGSDAADAEPAWSPDGRRIAFASVRSGTWNVWVMDADGSGAARLIDEFSTSPVWSPDGSRIAYLTAAGAISVASADGSDRRALTSPPPSYSDERPSWSPDGSSLVFARRQTYGNDPQLHVISSDGSNERRLTSTEGASRFPSWSPDGERIVFTHLQRLSVINPDGSGMRPLLDVWGEDLTPDWGTSTAVPNPQAPGAPMIHIFSPEARPYPAGYEVGVLYVCESVTSFVVSCEGDVPAGSFIHTQAGQHTFTVRATDAEGRTATATVTYEVFDWLAPTVVVRAPNDGAEYGVGEPAFVDYECLDEPGGSGVELCDGEVRPGEQLDTSRLGTFTVHFWAVDGAQNVGGSSVTYHVVDRKPPTITLASPPEGAVYVLGEEVFASFSCGDEPGGSGLGSCVGDVPSGAPLDTATVGAKSFSVRARDGGNNATTLTRNYRVVYPFSGFSSPLTAFPETAVLDAGRTVPVKFSLGGDRGLEVLARSTWTRFHCGNATPLAAGEPAGGRLSYHAGRYQLQVETPTSWAGSCRRLALTFADGATYEANVLFR